MLPPDTRRDDRTGGVDLRAMSWVVACVLCAVGATGCGTLTRVALPSETVAQAPPSTTSAPAAAVPVSDVSGPTADSDAPAVPAETSELGDPEFAASAAAATDAVAPTDAAAPTAAQAGDTAATDDRFEHIVTLLLQSAQTPSDEDAIPEEYDPWERFNEKTFEFNRRLDRYVLKPVATAYDKVVPDRIQSMVANGFDNIRWLPRFLNSLLQAKWNGAAREFGRFLINSTLGIGGLFDIAKQEFHIEKSREDFGQTLGVWGAGPGPFLVVPLLPPLTVRDAVGFVVDGAMNPLNYVLPLWPVRLFMNAGEAINERSLNLELYQGFEETVIDMYSAVRHGYLQRREQLIKE